MLRTWYTLLFLNDRVKAHIEPYIYIYIKNPTVLHSSLHKVNSWKCFLQKNKTKQNKDEIRLKRQQHSWQGRFSGEKANPERMVASQRALLPQLR